MSLSGIAITLRARRAILAAFLTGYILLSVPHFTGPFVRHWESVSASNAQFARNHVRFGIAETRLGLLSVSGHHLDFYDDLRTRYYQNHPSFLTMALLTSLFRVFGDREWVFRLCMLMVAVANILLFSVLARRLVGDARALIATGILTFNPSFAYFSQVVPELAVTLVPVQIALIAYLRWWESGRRGDLALLVLAIVLGTANEWFAYATGVVILLHRTVVVRKRRGIGFWIVGLHILLFAGYLGYLWWLDPENLLHLKAVLKRSLSAHGEGQAVRIADYVQAEVRETLIYFGPAVAFLVVAWLVRFLRKRDSREWIVLLMGCYGFYEVAFPSLVSEHDFFTYPLVPASSLGAALGLEVLWNLAAARSRVWAFAVCCGILAMIAAQSGLILESRLRRVAPPYDFAYRMGSEVRGHTGIRDRVLVLGLQGQYQILSYYADRYIEAYWARSGRLIGGNGPGCQQSDVSSEEMVRLARANFDVVVISTRPLALRHFAYFAGSPERAPPGGDWLSHLQIQESDSELVQGFERISVSREVHGGFVFYRLR